MNKRILKNDLSKNRIILATLFLFIMLASLLVTSSISVILQLLGNIDHLFATAEVPHYVQMHSGELDQEAIDSFVNSNKLVDKQQTVTLLNLKGTNIIVGDRDTSEASSIIENSFVKQNKQFDFLLDTNNEIIKLNEGEIAVPLYHKELYNLKMGDPVQIVDDTVSMSFIIKAFVRDAQMNPSIVTSKRFVISDADWDRMISQIGETEYLIEFLLHDPRDISTFEVMYQGSNLPQKGTAITLTLFKVLSAITDGIMVVIIILISLLLAVISALCLRFTLIASIEEDMTDIGAMKAIGMPLKSIKKLYMIKYSFISATACIIGFALSFFLTNILTSNMLLYMGRSPQKTWAILLPFAGAVIVYASSNMYCLMVLNRLKKHSTIEALRYAQLNNGNVGSNKLFRLSRSFIKNIHLHLGLKTVITDFKLYGVLCLIFASSTFLIYIPTNFHHTLQSQEFITYMGAGQSDIRIDLFSTKDATINEQYNNIESYLKNNDGIENYTSLVTAAYKVKNSDGLFENIKIENGDFSIFPLRYEEGHPPNNSTEIALSGMNASELKKGYGDTLTLLVDGEELDMTVCGIYQDITNGGKTAKGLLPYEEENILWYIINISTKNNVEIAKEVKTLRGQFPEVKVTDMRQFVKQTLGGLTQQLSLASKLALILSLIIVALITTLFFRMLMIKETGQIAIMRSLGLPYKGIRFQYLTRAFTVLIIGLFVGYLTAHLLGPKLAGFLITGVNHVTFIVEPIMSYIISPILLIVTVAITILYGSTSIKNIQIKM